MCLQYWLAYTIHTIVWWSWSRWGHCVAPLWSPKLMTTFTLALLWWPPTLAHPCTNFNHSGVTRRTILCQWCVCWAPDINIDLNPIHGSPALSSDAINYAHTDSDGNNLFHQYLGCFPSHDPEKSTSLSCLCDGPMFQHKEANEEAQLPDLPLTSLWKNYFEPFLNAMVWWLMNWFYDDLTQTSLQGLDHLVHDIILADDFDANDLHQFNAHREIKRMDDAPKDLTSLFFAADGWQTTSISIQLPCKKVKQPEDQVPQFQVQGLHYCKMTEVVKSAFEEPAVKTYHTTPYKLFWQSDRMCPPECVITELYTADTMLEKHARIKSDLPKVPGCNLEIIITGIMLWSNSTHLASFGNAALWPIYLFVGNQSKYTCAKPSTFAAHHLAYIPKVSLTYDLKCYITDGCSLLAIWYHTRFLHEDIWYKCNSSSADTLQARTYASYLGVSMQLQFPTHIWIRHGN